MLDRIFAIQTGLSGSNENKETIRKDVFKEIGAEMQRFQRKYQESRELINTMRKNFLKELQHLKTKDVIGTQTQNTGPSTRMSRLGGGQLSSFQQQQQNLNNQQNYIEFSFFSPTEGMDEETCGIFNDSFHKIKSQFESKLAALNAINQELAWKVSLVDESKKVSDMTARELIELTFAKQKDRVLLWLQIKVKFSPEELDQIAEEEFAYLVNGICEREIKTQIQAISQESQFQIKDAKEKMQKEINMLRMNLASRDEDYDKLKLQKMLEVERAREEGYDRAEKRLIVNMKNKEAKFQEEREVLQKQVEDGTKVANTKYSKLYLQSTFTKWRLLVKIAQIKMNGDDQDLGEIMAAVTKGNTNLYIEQIREQDQQIEQQKEAEEKLRAEKERWQIRSQTLEDRIVYLSKELGLAQEEISKARSTKDSHEIELRAIDDKLQQTQRVNRSLQDLVSTLETSKADLEGKVANLKEQIQEHQTQKLTLPLTQMIKEELVLSNPVASTQGINNQLSQDGYGSDGSPVSKRGNATTSNRFNSQIYAQKQLESMIEQRQNTMTKVYTAAQVQNMAVDTCDLIDSVHRGTQYKNTHHDAQWDTKEKAKVKIFRDAEVQSEPLKERDAFKAHDESEKGKWITDMEHMQLEQLKQSHMVLQEQLSAESLKVQDLRVDQLENSKRLQEVNQLYHDLQQECQDLQSQLNNQRAKSGASGGRHSASNNGLNKKMTTISRVGLTQARLDANKKRREDMMTTDDAPLVNGDETKLHLVPDIEINDEELKKAMDYMNQEDWKRSSIEGRTASLQETAKKMPQPYKRLWNDVQSKSRKAKELQRVLNDQKKLEWLKLLLSNNHLHLTSGKSIDLLKQLQIYEESVLYKQSQLQDSKNRHSTMIKVKGFRASVDTKSNQILANQNFDLGKLVDLFEEEQEELYQRAIKQWNDSVQIRQQQAAHNVPETYNLQDHHHEQENTQSNDNVSVLTPKGEDHVLPQAEHYVSMYITEQHNANHHPMSSPSFMNQAVKLDDKGIQTDLYLIETLIQDSQLYLNTGQNDSFGEGMVGPGYQKRLNQYMATKQGGWQLPSMSTTNYNGNTSVHSSKAQQPYYAQNGMITNNVASIQSMNTSKTQLHSRVGLSSHAAAATGSQVLESVYQDIPTVKGRQQVMFNNQRIRLAGSHQIHPHAAIMSNKQRRSALAQSHNQSPMKTLDSGFVLEVGTHGNGKGTLSNNGQKRHTLLSAIKEPEIQMKVQDKSVVHQLLIKGVRGGGGSQLQYQAISTTNFLDPRQKLKGTTQQERFNDVTMKGGAGYQKSNNAAYGLPHEKRGNNTDNEEMFGSSEMNTLPPYPYPYGIALTVGPQVSQRGKENCGSFGFEPRIPTARVNPSVQDVQENLDFLKGAGSLIMLTKRIASHDDLDLHELLEEEGSNST